MYWKQWLQTLITLVVLLGMVELLLPGGELAKFARLVLGLSLLLALLQPVMLLLEPGLLGADLSWLPVEPFVPEVEERAQRLQWAATKALWAGTDQKLKQHLEGILAGLDGVQRVRVQLPPEWSGEAVQIFLDPWESGLRQEARELVASLLNLPLQRIAVLAWQ